MLILDHFFVLTEPQAPVAGHLRDWGLQEGSRNDHPGQGTSNRRFFFVNSMLELLWIRDAAEADAGPARDLQLRQRATAAHASPFGLIFRCAEDSAAAAPFPGWPYHPAYLDATQFLHIGANAGQLQEPLCVHLPSAMPPARDPHRNSERVEAVSVRVASERLSEVLQIASRSAGLVVKTGPAHLLEITLGGGRRRGTLDLRPALPLVISAG